jgi:ABC-type transporter Mla subunit MlaD
MATFKQSLDDFIAALKTNAANDEQLFEWLQRAASRLAQMAQRIQEQTAKDVQSFLAQKKSEFDAYRAAMKAARIANGEETEE